MTRLGRQFRTFWAASTVGYLGTAITAVALPVLVIQELGADSVQVGLVNASLFVPYAVLGLFAGVYVDRWPRKRTLVAAQLVQAVSIATIPALWFAGVLTIVPLILVLLVFGSATVFSTAASQSLLPSLVARERLVDANSRLDQSSTAGQTAGPMLGGGLIALIGAPLAIAVDAVSFIVEAVINASLRVREPVKGPAAPRSLQRELAEGLAATYRHRSLGPLAISTHVWFVANAAGLTTVSILALRDLGLSAFHYGLLMAGVGVAGLIGASLAPPIGRRFGVRRAVIGSRMLYPVAWLLIAAIPVLSQALPAVAILAFAMCLYGLIGGVENGNEMGYWQQLTPDNLLGRTNATRRSANRTSAAIGAAASGGLIASAGIDTVMIGVAVTFAIAALIVVVPRAHDDAPAA